MHQGLRRAYLDERVEEREPEQQLLELVRLVALLEPGAVDR